MQSGRRADFVADGKPPELGETDAEVRDSAGAYDNGVLHVLSCVPARRRDGCGMSERRRAEASSFRGRVLRLKQAGKRG